MKVRIFFLVILVSGGFISCNRNNLIKKPIQVVSLDSAGIFENYELWNPSDDAVHIDPTNLNDSKRDGSIAHPYKNFTEITWKNSTVYALKRGTALQSSEIRIQANGVTLASYGEGKRPVILCTDNSGESGNRHAIISDWDGIDNTVIRDLEITAPEANSCIRFLTDCKNIRIINCKLHDSEWGFRSIGNSSIYIFNTEVYNILDDGMYLENNSDIEIANCYVYNVNQNWHPPSTPDDEAGGDGIQFQNCNNWIIHHNIIDRGNSGNKFCFISNNVNQNFGIVEFNIFSGPYTNGACVYFHDGRNIVVRYNYFKAPSQSPVFTHASGIMIYGNIFDGLERPAIATSDARFYNNVFYNMSLCIQGGTIESVNNVFVTKEGGKVYQVENLSGSNNLFASGEPTTGSFSGDPKFANPSTGDFHLTQGSDCIDKGIPVGIPYDMEGNQIPQGNNPDIGVFEYISETEE